MKEASRLQVLLIEDNMGDIRLTEEAFKECAPDIVLTYVLDGVEAMAYMAEHRLQRPDLILLDLNLPRKDGRAVLSTLKSDVAWREVPVIVLTTSNATQDVREAYAAHANCYINKPVDYDGFVRIVEQVAQFWLRTVTLPSRVQ